MEEFVGEYHVRIHGHIEKRTLRCQEFRLLLFGVRCVFLVCCLHAYMICFFDCVLFVAFSVVLVDVCCSFVCMFVC